MPQFYDSVCPNCETMTNRGEPCRMCDHETPDPDEEVQPDHTVITEKEPDARSEEAKTDSTEEHYTEHGGSD